MFRIIDWVERVCERIYSGPEDTDPGWAHALDNLKSYYHDRDRKDRLERELANAGWTLDYEKRLAKLQKKTRAQRSEAVQDGINTDRLRRLEHHLAGLRRSISRD